MALDTALVMILAGGEGKRLFPLTRDRAKRVIKPNPRYSYADIIAYAFMAYQDLIDNEPKT